MTSEYRNFEVVVAIGTTRAAPQVDALAMPARIVRSVRIRIPPGPNGAVGFALGSANQRVIPWNANSWFVGNDEVIELPLTGQIDSGAWQMQSYNTGTLPHTLYVTFTLDPIHSQDAVPMITPLRLSA